MTKRRIFVAINLPEKLKKRLKEYREQHEELPVRWTKTASLHLTLVFIGYVDNEQMLEACRTAREVTAEFEPFFINFKKIILGPVGKEPRMIWLEGEQNEELARLRDKLQDALFNAETGFVHKETRPLTPHITLARLKAGDFRLSDSRNIIEWDFAAQAEVNSVEVMESDLKFDGAEYATLESCVLGMDDI